MSKLFRRSSVSTCYFCQSRISPAPKDPRSFRCPECLCWNTYNKHGEIIGGDDAAMREERLNLGSFAKRGATSNEHLPNAYGPGPFCTICQRNQYMLMSMLSDYLPDPSEPDYNTRIQTLPAYRETLHQRYPPVCPDCAPAVEAELDRRNNMARQAVLKQFLKGSGSAKERARSVSETKEPTASEISWKELLAWRIRGALWFATFLFSLVGCVLGAFGHKPDALEGLRPYLPIFALTSILWTAWNPLYSQLRKASLQRREVRIAGKDTYAALQLLSWCSRLLTTVLLALPHYFPQIIEVRSKLPLSLQPAHSASIYFSTCLILEIFVFFRSLTVIRLASPAPIRLMTKQLHKSDSMPSSTSHPVTPTLTHEPDLLASLSLSSNTPYVPPPSAQSSNPIFGLPSLRYPSAPPLSTPTVDDKMDEDPSPDAMDWSPTSEQPRQPTHLRARDDGSWLKPQRFFAPEKPTGLESLFANTRLVDDVREPGGRWVLRWNWGWVYFVSTVPLILGLGHSLWMR